MSNERPRLQAVESLHQLQIFSLTCINPATEPVGCGFFFSFLCSVHVLVWQEIRDTRYLGSEPCIHCLMPEFHGTTHTPTLQCPPSTGAHTVIVESNWSGLRII